MTKRAIAICVALVVGCSTPVPEHFPPSYRHVPATWSLLEETTVTRAPQAMVVTEHPIASEVGARVLRSGGNAVDAAVAVAFALAVVHPTAGNLGGGGFMVYRGADGEVAALDYRERAPLAATRDMYLDSAGNLTEMSITGHLASGVPGSVAGMAAAHERFGSRPFAELLSPAIELATRGVALDEYRANAFSPGKVEIFQRFEGSAAKYLAGGEPPGVGILFQQPDLARTLEDIARSGADGFYRGRVADLIVAEMERGGGLITHEDLAGYEVSWRDPVAVTYRGHTIYSMPPSSSGGVTMGETLNILEGFDPLPAFGSPEHVHLLAEAMRRAFIDRNQSLGDPDFNELPLERLLSKEYAAELRGTIDRDEASVTPEFGEQLREGDHTTHFSIVDESGNAVSVTTTINSSFGNGVVVAGAGFLLNNEMDDFTGAVGQPNQFGLIQGEANAIEPGKRMLSAMSPSIVVDAEGDLLLVLGAPGGPRIITAVTQVISNVVDHGMSLTEAVAAPRVHHQALPDRLAFEPNALTASTRRRLRSLGHELYERTSYVGIISAIMSVDGRLEGVADPRGGGRPAGY